MRPGEAFQRACQGLQLKDTSLGTGNSWEEQALPVRSYSIRQLLLS